MKTLDRLVASARRGVTGVLAAAALACGGDGPTKPQKTLFVNASAPATVVEGESMPWACTTSGTVANPSVSASYNGAALGSGNGSISGTYTPTVNGSVACSASGEGKTADGSAPVTVTPLAFQNGSFNGAEDVPLYGNLRSLVNQSGGSFSINGAPSDARFTPLIVGDSIRSSSPVADANGQYTVPVRWTRNGIMKDAVITFNHQAMTDFEYELREARSDSLVLTPATIQIGGVTYAAVNGVFRGQVTPGTKTVRLVANAETFKSDRVQNPDGSLAGINWEGNDQITVNFANDFANPAKIIRLAKEGSPYGSLAEMMRIYEAVWAPAPENTHITPVFPVARIRLYIGPVNTNWGCNIVPDANQLATMTQGALDTRAQFQTPDYQIDIDTISEMPSATPQSMPEGNQVVCMTNLSGNSNGTIRYPNEKIRGSVAYLNAGFSVGTVRDELYEMHSGQKLEDNANGNTFFAGNPMVLDLTSGDIDIIQKVNNLYARDAEKKRLVNNSAPYRLRP